MIQLSTKHCKRSFFIQPSKPELRKYFREVCRNISPSYREASALAALQGLVRQEFYKKSRHIACYLPVKHEFDTTPIIHELQKNKICYLPVLQEDNTLSFIRYDQDDNLHFNRYSILEPMERTNQILPQELDIVITPLVAFDEKGYRLGAGGGFYDRTFHFLLNNPITKPALIGLGYAAQQADDLPAEKWDIKLNAVLTEKKVIMFDL